MIGNRIKVLRESLFGKKISQEEFGELLGVSRSVIANIEYGRVEPSPVMIRAICLQFDVNETWLRTGEGEMFLPKDPDDELADFMGTVLREDIRTSVAKQLIDLIAHLPPEVLHSIAEVARERAAMYQESLPPNNKEG